MFLCEGIFEAAKDLYIVFYNLSQFKLAVILFQY